MLEICRTCLQQITETNYIKMESSEFIQVKNELSLCVPEMAFELVKDPIMCTVCLNALHTSYAFKNRCLQTEELIRNYIQSTPYAASICIKEVYNSINVPLVEPEFLEMKGPFNVSSCEPSYETDSVENTENNTPAKSELVLVTSDMKIKEEEMWENENSGNNLEDDDYTENNVDSNDVVESSTSKHTSSVNAFDKPFSCQLCNFKCARKVYLTKHFKYNHAGRKPFSCNVCDFTTSHKTHLEVHKRIHSGEKPFTCDSCPYSTSFKQNLQKHMRVHNGDKPYTCNMCEFSTGHHSSLRNHIKIHTGSKPFTCDLCDFTSAYSGSLTAHKKLHTGEKPFVCNICDFRTLRNHTLILHMKTHAERELLSCNLCHYSTKSKKSLIRHVKVHSTDRSDMENS